MFAILERMSIPGSLTDVQCLLGAWRRVVLGSPARAAHRLARTSYKFRRLTSSFDLAAYSVTPKPVPPASDG